MQGSKGIAGKVNGVKTPRGYCRQCLVRASQSNGSNGAQGHIVPPAWPGRAVMDPNFKPRSDAKVTS